MGKGVNELLREGSTVYFIFRLFKLFRFVYFYV